MATDRPRFTISLDDETFDRVEQYRIDNRYSTRSKAVEALIRDGLYKLLSISAESTEKAPSLTDEALRVAAAYDRADARAKQVVDLTLEPFMGKKSKTKTG